MTMLSIMVVVLAVVMVVVIIVDNGGVAESEDTDYINYRGRSGRSSDNGGGVGNGGRDCRLQGLR